MLFSHCGRAVSAYATPLCSPSLKTSIVLGMRNEDHFTDEGGPEQEIISGRALHF